MSQPERQRVVLPKPTDRPDIKDVYMTADPAECPQDFFSCGGKRAFQRGFQTPGTLEEQVMACSGMLLAVGTERIYDYTRLIEAECNGCFQNPALKIIWQGQTAKERLAQILGELPDLAVIVDPLEDRLVISEGRRTNSSLVEVKKVEDERGAFDVIIAPAQEPLNDPLRISSLEDLSGLTTERGTSLGQLVSAGIESLGLSRYTNVDYVLFVGGGSAGMHMSRRERVGEFLAAYERFSPLLLNKPRASQTQP